MKSRQKPASKRSKTKTIEYSPTKHTISEWVVKKLRSRVRSRREISVPEIRNHLRKHYHISVHDSTLRSIIHRIRVNGRIPLLIANGNGYYVAKTTKEVIDYMASLQKRIRQIGAIKIAIDRQAHTKLGKQYKTTRKKAKHAKN